VGKKVIGWSFAVIAGYLALKYYTGFARDETSASSGAVSLIDAFQGR
jgi:hypothetical protein